MLDTKTDYPDVPSQPSDGSSASGLGSPNAQHQTFLSAPFLSQSGEGGVQFCLPKPLHMVLHEILGLAHGLDLASLDLAPFFGVPYRAVSRQVPVGITAVAEGKAVLGMG